MLMPLVDSELTPDLFEFAELYSLENFPTDYLVEKADIGFLITNVYARKHFIVASPIEGPSRFMNTKYYLNIDAIERQSKLAEDIAYGYSFTCRCELANCTNYWTASEVRERLDMALEEPTNYSINIVLFLLGEVLRRTSRFELSDLIHYMKSQGISPFTFPVSIPTVKWLN